MTVQAQIYDDTLDFEQNKLLGPFGGYSNSAESRENKNEPQYDFFGVPVYSPFGIGAGPLPTAKFIDATLAKGYDIVTLKSVRTASHPVNEYPHVRPVSVSGDLKLNSQVLVASEYSEPLAAANSFGIPSVEPSEWQPFMKESFGLLKKGQALLVAFQGTAHGKGKDDFVEDHVKGIQLIKETGANIIEINLSCPNEGEKVLACFDTDITSRIVTAVKQAHPEVQLIIKIAYFADKQALKELIRNIGTKVEGISAINTVPATIVDTSGEIVFPGRAQAGVSGAPIKWAGLEMTTSLAQIRKELGLSYKIIGMGGVVKPQDFHDYIDAGADIVMSVTGAMWNPNLAQDIKDTL